MIRAALHALLSHWLRRPFQLVTLLLGLATATALWSGVQAINAEARASYDRAAESIAGAAQPALARADGAPIPLADWVALRRAGHRLSPVIEGRIMTAAGPVRLVGIDPFTLSTDQVPAGVAAEGGAAPDLSFQTPPGLLLAAPATAERLAGAQGLPPVRVSEGAPPGTAYADFGIAATLLDRDGLATRLVITAEPAPGVPPADTVVPGLVRRTATADPATDTSRLTDSFHLNLTAFGLLSFAVGLFIVRGAIGLAFEQRRPVFRTLRALGLSRATLVGLLTGELLILAIVAGAIGTALGWVIATLLIPDVAATLRGLYGAEVEGTLTLEPAWWLSGLAISVLGTGIAAAASLWQVARLPLLAPAQPRAWARASARTMRLQAMGAALCLAVAAIAVLGFNGLVSGFAALGGLLLAAALILPLTLDTVLAALSRTAHGARAEWVWADTRQQVPGLSLALMALLLALAANIGVGTMVNSFRLTFTGWLDQRLAAEVYLQAEDDAQARRIADWLAPRADAVLPIRDAEARIAGAPGSVTGVADHPTYRESWPLIAAAPGAWDAVVAGEAALVNEQLARRNDLWPGDDVTIDGTRLAIAGVFSDYGNPRVAALVHLDRFDTLFPGAPRTRLVVRTDPADADALADAIVAEFGLPPMNVQDQAAIKRLSLSIFERTFTVTGALNVLTLSVAALAILTSLLTIAALRQPQLAPVWALGLTRATLARIEIARAALLALLTFVLAVPVGLVLAQLLLGVVNVEAFGWKLPMYLFPGDWLRLAALSVLAAVLAASLPALRLARTPPAELLKVFAHER